MKPLWIVFLLLYMTAPAWCQSSDTVEPSRKVQPRKAKGEVKTIGDEKADTRKKTRDAPADKAVAGDEEKKKKEPAPVKKPFIDENGDGLNDSPAPRVTRNPRSATPPDEHRMDRFTDPDGDGINDGRGFERTRGDRGRNALEENLKERNRLREKNGK